MNKGSHFNGQFPLPEWQTSWDNNKDDIWTLLFRSRCMISWLVGLTNSSVVIRFKLSLMNRKNAKMLEEAREGPFEPTLFWLRGGLTFSKNHPQCLFMSIADRVVMLFWVLADSSLCQNGKQVEKITKMIFELCYIEAINLNWIQVYHLLKTITIHLMHVKREYICSFFTPFAIRHIMCFYIFAAENNKYDT